MRTTLALVASLALVGVPSTAPARHSATIHRHIARIAATMARGVVSAADPRAAEAGAAMLRQGGSAADAAIATMLTLTVVEPESSGIGGGSYLVFRDANGTIQTYDNRETAPRAATGSWFLGPDGKPRPFADVVPGGTSVGVPGNISMAAHAHRDHGRLPWRALFQPAIALARDGFVITPRLYGALQREARVGAFSAGGRALFYRPDGSPLPAGTRVRNPALARFLAQIAARGPAAFYHGQNAAAIVGAVNHAAHNPSPMKLADLAAYDSKVQPPVCGSYRGYRLCGMGPSSSGGLAVIQTLAMLERFDLARLGPNNPTSWHLIAEAMRLAYADRDQYVGDPGYVSVPVAGLLDRAYLAQRSALISPTSTMPIVAAGLPAGAPKMALGRDYAEHGTSSFAAADGRGNVASITSTIESVWGSGLVVNGYYLNNELTDFSFAPSGADGAPVANRVEGGKRPRSSMAPMIVTGPDGRVRLAVGAAGGPTIPAQVLKTIIAVIDWKMSAREAIAAPVLFAPSGPTIYVEDDSPLVAMIPALTALGHGSLKTSPHGTYKANAIEQIGGHWSGAGDPRSEGVAVAQ
jgi:gamma-glutamyltranspeptidase/glutathione hydrolase